MLKLCCFIFLFIGINCFAQKEPEFGIWGNLGAGYGSIDKGEHKVATLTSIYGFSARYNIWTISYQKRSTGELSLVLFENELVLQNLKSTSILAGISGDIVSSKEGVTKVCYLILAGISFLNTDGYEDVPGKGYQPSQMNIKGFPIEVGFKINLTKVIGISLTANANFNKYANSLGGNLNFIFGKL